ncbi:APC family permease [Brevibacterium sp. UCMA 11754]|uniref:APC family permease n=1 Tax=Brevibacterium sp. UCMA 11754 TaxID=2749198 RepID=UPI001F2C4501|nr:APC family permease [Brevibacterium sp. UCMA 11754]MCF2571123.1 APC family permease [Brevibacterium sp. UCMA 11754]
MAVNNEFEHELVSPTAEAGELKKGTMGVLGASVMAVALITPLTTLSSNMVESLVLGVGPATVVVTVVVTVLLFFFSAGYSVLGRFVVDSGAYAAYAAHGLGRMAGSGIGLIAAVGYNLATVAFVGIGGYFLMNSFVPLGLDLPWWVYSIVILVLVTWLGVIGVGVASKVNSVICALQFVMIFVFFLAVLFQSPGNFTGEVFSMTGVTPAAFGLSIVFILLSLSGFESSSAYGEEVREPVKTIPRVTYLVLITLSILFALGSWVLVAASNGDPVGLSGGDPGTLVPTLYSTYLGGWTGPVTNFIIAVTIVSAAIAFNNLSTRYMYASARAGILPAALARTHSRFFTPHIAVFCQVGVTVLLLVPFAVSGGSPMVDLLPAIGGYNALNMMTKMTTVSVSTIASKVKGTIHGSTYETLIAPTIAIVGFLAATCLVIAHYGDITGSGTFWVNLMPVMILFFAGWGAIRQRQVDRIAASLQNVRA